MTIPRTLRHTLAALFIFTLSAPAGDLAVDFSKPNGTIRRLNGGNNGPLNYGEVLDLTEYHKELGIPFTRLHDSDHPYADIVDIHAIFRNFDADPSDPASYTFGPTDDYIRAINNTGAKVVYRLGESIEHAKRKRYVHPPKNLEKWSDICVGIIRHYNEGWAEGFHWEIPYWEIWNEPENGPMWTGTAEQYYQMYSITAKKLKARFPNIKVGGPANGAQGEYKDGVLIPNDFLKGLFAHIQKEKAPMDFFSWHAYTKDPAEFTRRAREVRKYMDEHGFTKAESHLNEWNYLPDDDWGPMTEHAGEVREAWYARQGGMEGAAFTACALMDLQEAPIDVANYYTMENTPFGLFTFHGTPKKTFYTFKAFRALVDTPARVETQGGETDKLSLCAGLAADGKSATVLVSNFKSADTKFALSLKGLPWSGGVQCETFLLDETHKLESVKKEKLAAKASTLSFELKAPAVLLIKLVPE